MNGCQLSSIRLFSHIHCSNIIHAIIMTMESIIRCVRVSLLFFFLFIALTKDCYSYSEDAYSYDTSPLHVNSHCHHMPITIFSWVDWFGLNIFLSYENTIGIGHKFTALSLGGLKVFSKNTICNIPVVAKVGLNQRHISFFFFRCLVK